MEFQTSGNKRWSRFRYYLWQFLLLITIAVTLHYGKMVLWKQFDFRYKPQTYLDVVNMPEMQCNKLLFEITHLRKEITEMRAQFEEIHSWKVDFEGNCKENLNQAFDRFHSDKIGIFDYASEYAGGSIISTPETTPLPSRFGLRFFGTIDWVGHSDPGILLQPNTFPGKCFAFYGDKARIRVRLGRPIVITHVSLEHMRIGGETPTSAPRDFEIWALGERGEESLGRYVYDLDDSIIQTFRVIEKNQTFRNVELRILSNHGNAESTCVYRFRVHSVDSWH
ncbi:SUN domain-containing protein 2-like [Tribolium madens]|uniref:SUN domain-containing protein 2-like n=1 Tax=Tribolium madens TaxID=41895 RepID=UPI001CF764EE|nr:SUN domain-containing protein 2-like [Tribolium madens]